MKKYAAYKPSGVEWLGEVPDHWDVKRLRFALAKINPVGSKLALPDDALVSFVPMNAVGEYGGLTLDTEKPLDEIGSGYTYFADNDVVVAKITPCFENGKGAIARGLTNGVAFGTTELHVLRPGEELDSQFLFYLTASELFRRLGEGHMYGAGGQKRVPEEFIKNLLTAIPPLPEQRAIAAFLDERTAHLDGLIQRKEDLLKLLAEQRAALITRAVTRGLNAAAPLQDSGVPWLEQGPAHWQVMSIRRLLTVRSGDQTTTEDLQDEGFPVFGGNGFRGYYPSWNTEANSILIGRYGALCGNVRVVKERVWATEHAFRVFPLMSFNVDFLGFALEAINLNQFSARAAQPGLNATLVRENFCALPPPLEQSQIVDFIHRSNKRLDKMTDITTREIEKLREYRAALITAAVTGRIDVRAAVAVPELVEA